MLGCEAEELRPETIPKRKPWARKKRPKSPEAPAQLSAVVPEMEIEAAPG